MVRRLTKKKALEICSYLWAWILNEVKKNPNDPTAGLKMSWPGWEIYGRMAYDCPCCEYVLQSVYPRRRPKGFVVMTPEACRRHCPLYSLWEKAEEIGIPTCETPGTPYDNWVRHKTLGKDPAEAAQQIVNACVKELEKLDA